MTVPLLLLDTVDSTMREAERQADAGRRGPLVICAAAQTGGTGRHGRTWFSPPGNLYWTILLDADADRPRDAAPAFAAALAVMDALAVPDRLSLKWPNDVLLDGRKLAGVLVQASVIGAAARTVIGIGINVATAPGATAYPATSLAEAGLDRPLPIFRDRLTDAFLTRRAQWHAGGFASLRSDVVASLGGVGQPTTVTLDRERTRTVEGVSEGIDASGALLLRRADGTLQTVVAGDISGR